MNYIYSLFTGGLLSLMVICNGLVAEKAGNYASSVIIHFIGLIGIILIILFTRSKFDKLKGVPLYMYLGGIIGIGTVLLTNVSYSHLNVSLTVALSLLGQSVTSIIVDHFGFFDLPVKRFEKKKIIGLIIIAVGIFVMTIG